MMALMRRWHTLCSAVLSILALACRLPSVRPTHAALRAVPWPSTTPLLRYGGGDVHLWTDGRVYLPHHLLFAAAGFAVAGGAATARGLLVHFKAVRKCITRRNPDAFPPGGRGLAAMLGSHGHVVLGRASTSSALMRSTSGFSGSCSRSAGYPEIGNSRWARLLDGCCAALASGGCPCVGLQACLRVLVQLGQSWPRSGAWIAR